MKRLKKKTIIVVVWVIFALMAFMPVHLCLADPESAPDSPSWLSSFRLSGYATIACTFDENDQMAPMRDISQEFDGYDSHEPWTVDSRLGIQAHYQFSSKMEAIVQGVLRNQADLNFADSIESAFLGINPVPAVKLRAGRFAYDAFLMSDTRNIGYAYLWVRPPVEFYGWIPIFYIDGADAQWTINSSRSQWKVKAQAGRHNLDIKMGETIYEFETTDLLSFTVSRLSGPLELKAGYSTFSSNNEVPDFRELQGGLGSIADLTSGNYPGIHREALSLQREIAFEDVDISYATLGAMYDDGDWVVHAEIARSTSTSEILPHGTMGYIGVGRRIGDWTPYCIYSAIRAENDILHPRSDWSAIGQRALQEQAVSILNSTRMHQNTASLGIRWNFHYQASLKLQWDHTRVEKWGYGLWQNHPRLMTQTTDINAGTLSLEVIF